MEPIRPEVDKFVLNWVRSAPLSRNFFFEERDGNCRLMAQFAEKLSQTAPTWARLVAPVAEWFAQELFRSNNSHRSQLPSRLTQRYRREAKGADPLPKPTAAVQPIKVCRTCGAQLSGPSKQCAQCWQKDSVQHMQNVARVGRQTSHTLESQAKRSATQKVNTQAAWDWDPSTQPSWLTPDFYSKRIQPILPSVSRLALVKALGVSPGYANEIRKGRLPHPRHWQILADLVGVALSS